MINLENPRKFRAFVQQANQVADNFLRANSRKYDLAEHAYPKELDLLASLIDGMGDSGEGQGTGAAGVRRDDTETDKASVVYRRRGWSYGVLHLDLNGNAPHATGVEDEDRVAAS